MKEKDLDKNISKKKLIVGIGALITILLIAGIAFAYYVATVTGTGKSIQGKIANLDIDFTDTADVNPTLQAPINDANKATDAYKNTFSVANKTASGSNIDAEYDVSLVISSISNELKSEFMKWELLKDGSVISSGNLTNATAGGELKLTTSKQQITLDSTAQNLEFRLWMSYSQTVDQSAMLGKSLKAKLKVTANEKVN